MNNYHKASEDMYYPPESADHRYNVRFLIISYFVSERLRPDTPPFSVTYYSVLTHTLRDPAADFHDVSSPGVPSFL